jgi:hypothetical protein
MSTVSTGQQVGGLATITAMKHVRALVLCVKTDSNLVDSYEHIIPVTI